MAVRVRVSPTAPYHFHPLVFRGVAQLGRAPRSGRGGRRFKSCHPDHFKKGITVIRLIIFLAIGGVAVALHAQEAAQPTVDLRTKTNEQNAPAPTAPSIVPDVPELSQLDEIFKQTSLGKTADNYRLHLEWMQLRNQVVNSPDVMAAKKAVESARTDLEKRQRLRQYYDIYYAHMQALAKDPQVKSGLNDMKAAHLWLLDQSRVRPSPSPAASPASSPAQENEH
jgi:hypothetical protein